jgi:hypothetical protein
MKQYALRQFQHLFIKIINFLETLKKTAVTTCLYKGIRKWFPIGKLDEHQGAVSAINCYNSLNFMNNRQAKANPKFHDD